jgi:Icc-related predicted phosphoesterase
VRITIVSDTHNLHDRVDLPAGDVLIHCGDMFDLFQETSGDIERMDEWFGTLDFDLILCTGGNHDVALEERARNARRPFRNAVYLADEVYDFRGIRFFGSPWTPELRTHAFYGAPDVLEKAWAAIPSDTDVLITHTPPADILDRSRTGWGLGCPLLSKQLERVKPRIHCFGHVHASRGQLRQTGTLYVNASSVNSALDDVYPPMEVDI